MKPPVYVRLDLLAALNRHCECSRDGDILTATCPGHEALAHDPKFAARMAFARTLSERMNTEEYSEYEVKE